MFDFDQGAAGRKNLKPLSTTIPIISSAVYNTRKKGKISKKLPNRQAVITFLNGTQNAGFTPSIFFSQFRGVIREIYRKCGEISATIALQANKVVKPAQYLVEHPSVRLITDGDFV